MNGGKKAGHFLILLSAAIPFSPLSAQEADLILPEEYSVPGSFHLRPDLDRQAEATARFLEALFLEETDGPDRALETKRKVLALDPGFTDLAMDVARQYLRSGETSEAISVLKDAAKASPNRSDPLVALSGVYLRQLQKSDLAEKYGLQALSASPDDSAPYQILYEIYKAGGQNQKIAALFARAMKREAADAGFWLDLVELRLRDPERRSGDLSGVTDMLERAQDAAGDRPELLVRTGDYFVLCNQPERAIPLYQLALKLRPSMEGLRDKLAEFLLQAGDASEATKLLEEIVARNPLDYRAYDQLAELYLQANEKSKALASLKQAVLVAPPDPRRSLNLVQLCLGAGDSASALSFSGEAEKTFPTLVEFTFLKALALGQAKRHEEALQTFDAIVLRAGNSRPEILNGDFYFSYGVSAEQAGRFVKAAEALKKSMELDPSNAARAANYLGFMWADRGENLDEAELLIRRAVEKEPENGAYLDSLGWVYFKKGLYAQALHELLKAAELLKEEDAEIFDHIGDAYEKLGKTSEAVSYWQKAAQLNPEKTSIAAKLEAHAAKIVRTPDAAEKSAGH